MITIFTRRKCVVTLLKNFKIHDFTLLSTEDILAKPVVTFSHIFLAKKKILMRKGKLLRDQSLSVKSKS